MNRLRPLYQVEAAEDAGSAPAASVETGEIQEDNVFEEMSLVGDDDYGDDVVDSAAADAPAEETPEAPAAADTDAQVAETSTAEPEPQQPVDISQLSPEQLATLQQQYAQQQESQAQQPTDEQKQEVAMQTYQKDVNALTEFYTLNDDERAQLESDPAAALPVLAAKMHYQVVNAVTHGIMGALPNAIQKTQQQHTANQQIQEKFMAAWPQLNESHVPDVLRVGQLYRQAHPNASFDQFIKDVGAQVVVQHGLHNAPAPAASAPQQQQQPSQVVNLPPDAPAGTGTVAVSPEPSLQPGNLWGNLSEEFKEE